MMRRMIVISTLSFGLQDKSNFAEATTESYHELAYSVVSRRPNSAPRILAATLDEHVPYLTSHLIQSRLSIDEATVAYGHGSEPVSLLPSLR